MITKRPILLLRTNINKVIIYAKMYINIHFPIKATNEKNNAYKLNKRY